MPQMKIQEAAGFLGVSDDTVRRWIDSGALQATKDASGPMLVDGHQLALFARERTATIPNVLGVASSARNRYVGEPVAAILTDGRYDGEDLAELEIVYSGDLFAGCEVVVSQTTANQRVAVAPLEVRAAAACLGS